MQKHRILTAGLAAPITLIAALTLTGCSPFAFLPGPTTSKQPETTQPEVEVEQGPVELTRAEAGQRYLDIVCQPNEAWDAYDIAWIALEDAEAAGGSLDITAVQEAAAELLHLRQQEAALLEDPRFVWPTSVQDQILLLQDMNLSDMRLLELEVNARNFDELWRISYPELTAEELRAPQEIRLNLGIDADTVASCRGHEQENDRLYAELQAYLNESDSGQTFN